MGRFSGVLQNLQREESADGSLLFGFGGRLVFLRGGSSLFPLLDDDWDGFLLSSPVPLPASFVGERRSPSDGKRRDGSFGRARRGRFQN